MSDIETRVKKITAKHFIIKTENLTHDTSIYNDLEADSLDFVEYIMNLEREFDISIPDDISFEIETIGDATKVVVQLLENKSQRFYS